MQAAPGASGVPYNLLDKGGSPTVHCSGTNINLRCVGLLEPFPSKKVYIYRNTVQPLALYIVFPCINQMLCRKAGAAHNVVSSLDLLHKFELGTWWLLLGSLPTLGQHPTNTNLPKVLQCMHNAHVWCTTLLIRIDDMILHTISFDFLV